VKRAPLLTDTHRALADRRAADGSFVSLTEARELYRRRVDRTRADTLVMAVYLRGVELDNFPMTVAALEVARDHGFTATLVIEASRRLEASNQ
jgi:hypothetical protein